MLPISSKMWLVVIAVDGIHFDDYFYPYRIPGKEFPDDAKYQQYGNGMNKEDWRRSNTDSIMVMISRAIKQENKNCRFVVSPFGVWRNADKDSINGSNTRADKPTMTISMPTFYFG